MPVIEESNLTFGERLQVIRRRKKMLQSDLARKTGLNQYCISNYEKDKHLPSYTAIMWLCKALNVTASELLGF